MDLDKILETMGGLNSILHKAFEDIDRITFKDKEALVIRLKTGTSYYFFYKDGKWLYDGWSQSLLPSQEIHPGLR